MIKKSQLKVLFDVMRATNDERLAYVRAGIGKTTFYEHKKNDIAFQEKLDEAANNWELEQVLGIREAGKKSWQARAWLLERKMPERFSLIKRHELTGAGGRPLLPPPAPSVDLSKTLSIEKLERLASLLENIDNKLDDASTGTNGTNGHTPGSESHPPSPF